MFEQYSVAAAHLAEQTASKPVSADERRKAATHAPRQARHAEVLRLCAGGASVAGIARGLGLHRKTVRVWLSREEPPPWTRRSQPSVIDPYRPHLQLRWSEGCRNAAALARELEALGAEIKPRVVRAWATLRRRATVDGLDARPSGERVTWKPPSVTGLVRLLQGDPGGGVGPDAAFVKRLRAQVPDLDRAAALARRLG